jgi:hypothetical protein
LSISASPSPSGSASLSPSCSPSPSFGYGYYLVHQYRVINYTNKDSIKILVNLQSSLAPSTESVYLQIWNAHLNVWETIDTESSIGANTDFDLTANINSNVDNYYDDNYEIAIRVMQLALVDRQDLAVDLVKTCFIIVYADKYSSKATNYTDEYSGKTTLYTGKFSTKTTNYSSKFSDKVTSYSGKFEKKTTNYTDKYPRKRC